VGPVIAAAGEAATEYACVVALMATYVALSAAGALWELLLLLVPLSVAGMLYNNASTSRLTKVRSNL
jgi:OCT family organic cation transporter-like MFS transporter 18